MINTRAGRGWFAIGSGLIGVASLMLLALAVPAGSAAATPIAAKSSSWNCDDGGVGARYPILLVHGFFSSASTWSTATQQYLAANVAHTCTATFDYGAYSTDWVTNPHIAPLLAQRITSLANGSSAAGGPGKVIVVAHSMGGLAVRCAAASSCNGGISGVAERLADVITYGTPNLGSWLKGYGRADLADVLGPLLSADARCNYPSSLGVLTGICKFIQAYGTSAAAEAFSPGSKQLNTANLPNLPSSVPVLALAGSLKITDTWFGHFTHTIGDVGDIAVSENSALAAANVVSGLGGKAVIDCGAIDIGAIVDPAAFLAEFRCWHGSETNSDAFKTDALAQITKVVAAGNPTLGKPWGPNQVGYGESRPTTVDNGGDPSGIVSLITWTSWGGVQAVGHGSALWVPPTVAVADGQEEPATIVAFHLGTCAGKPMYQAVTWYAPTKYQHFDDQSYIDICHGTYVSPRTMRCPSAGTLQAALPRGTGPATGIQCSEGWAGATANDGINAGTFMFRQVNGTWQAVDRQHACQQRQVPNDLVYLACWSN